MLKTGYQLSSGEYSVIELRCGHCNKHLGEDETIKDKNYNEIEGWCYCPYCGEPL